MMYSLSIEFAIIDLTNPDAWEWTKNIIKKNLLPMLEKQVNGIVVKLNTMIVIEQPYDFELPVERFILNLTMTINSRTKE